MEKIPLDSVAAATLTDPTPLDAARQARDAARNKLLSETADSEGARWASWYRDRLRSEGRPATGGFPGTVREARARLTARLRAEPRLVAARAATYEELESGTRVTYHRAKRDWLAAAEPGDPEDDDVDPTLAGVRVPR